MNLRDAPFPQRPVRVRPPGTSIRSQLTSLLWAAGIGAAALFFIVPPAIDLVADFGLRDVARRVPWAHLEHGRCSTKLVLASCEVEMWARPPGGPEVRRKVDYLFLDFHVGDYRVAVLADPARPERLTTDLGLAKLWNRLFTLLLAGPLFLGLGALLLFAPILLAPATFRENRRLVEALSRGGLRAAALRLVKLEKDAWTVAPHPPGAPGEERRWPMKGFPIVLDPGQGLVLGVTAGDGTVAVPLDAGLTFLDLTSEERRRLLAWIGPERLAWRPPGYVASPARARLRQAAPALLGTALVLGAAAGALAWWSTRGSEEVAYESVDLAHHGAAHGRAARLEGVLQNQLRVQSIWKDARAAHLEEYRPMTATGWRLQDEVEWLVKEVSVAAAVPERATRRGTVSVEDVPADARAAFARMGVSLSPRVSVLEPAPPASGSPGMGIAAILVGVIAAALLLVSIAGYAVGRLTGAPRRASPGSRA